LPIFDAPRRHDRQAGPDPRGHRRGPALPAHGGHARDAALLRAHGPGARGAPRRRARPGRGAEPARRREVGGLLTVARVKRALPVVVVVAFLLARMYPVALLLGVPLARARMGSVSNWVREIGRAHV